MPLFARCFLTASIFFHVLGENEFAAEKEFLLGFISPTEGDVWNGGKIFSSALPIAIEAVNSDHNFKMHNFSMKYIWRNSGCDTLKSTQAVNMLINEGVHVIIGPACSGSCEATHFFANVHNLPQISYSCASDQFSNKMKYPNFVRTVPPYSALATAFVALFREYKWKFCGIITSTTEVLKSAATQFNDALTHDGVSVAYTNDVLSVADMWISAGIARTQSSRARILLLCLDDSELGHFLWQFSAVGDTSFSVGWALLAFDNDVTYARTVARRATGASDLDMAFAFTGLLLVDFLRHSRSENSGYRTFLDAVRNRMKTDFNITVLVNSLPNTAGLLHIPNQPC